MGDKAKLNAAMIGVGDITMLHYPAYRDFPDAALVAICDTNPELLERRKTEWGVSKIYTDYHALLADPEIDIVEVNTPHHLHKKIVIDALQAGKNVACQKPMTVSIREAEEMIAAEKRSAGRLRVLENFVFYPAYVKARELVQAGEIGEPLTVRFKLGTGLFGSRWVPLQSEIWHLVESEKGMGQAVFDDGYHKLSQAINLFGDIETVKGFIDRSFHYVDMPGQLIWRYKNSPVLGSFDLSFTPSLYARSKYFSADERIEIVGSRGIINVNRCTAQMLNEPALILYRDGQRYLFDDLDTDWQASFTAGIRDFPLAIKGNRPTLLSGQTALDIIKFAFALIAAAKTGREMRPDEITDESFRHYLGLPQPEPKS